MVSSQPWRRNESSSRRACPSRQHCQVADELRRHGPEAKAGPTPLACGSLNLYRLSQTGPPPRTEPSAPTSAQQGPDWPSHHLPHWEGAVQSSHTAHRRVLEWDTPPRQAPTLFSQAYHATSYKLPQPEPSSCYSCRVSQLSHRDASLSCDQCPCSRRARAYSLTGSPTTPCVSFS